MTRGRSLRFDAVVEDPRDMGHLALYITMLTGALGRRPIHMHVDLARCPSVDAAGVDLLVELHRRLRDLGGRLTLLGPSTQIRHLVQLSGPDALPEMVGGGAPAPGEPSR
ncbi:hypothetical protein GCM10009827_097010 [Dactylosporangium maewongense]|uniref:STAS domain-containing protein n=1 Tax=Dactylosporangium maewongense TaxID=634393 RepID=A0ABP4NEX4_9ACTN